MEEINRYLTKDGKVFETKEDAILREAIVDQITIINIAQEHLKCLKKTCTHNAVQSLSDIKERYISGENDWGDKCVASTLYYRKGVCAICGKELEYQLDASGNVDKIVEGRW